MGLEGADRDMSSSSESWPDGIAGYDKVMEEKKPKYNIGDFRKEREAVLPFIGESERVVSRNFASKVSGESGYDIHDSGAVLVVTSEKLVMITSRGTFRPRFTVETFDYAQLNPGIGSSEREYLGRLHWFSGFTVQNGKTYLLEFWDSTERDEFVRIAGGALGGWHAVRERP
jgi:hypothetical protein